jgi:hypothetical protein
MDQQAVEIAAAVKRILETIPPDVTVVAACVGYFSHPPNLAGKIGVC